MNDFSIFPFPHYGWIISWSTRKNIFQISRLTDVSIKRYSPLKSTQYSSNGQKTWSRRVIILGDMQKVGEGYFQT